jgi:hypothetical protein
MFMTTQAPSETSVFCKRNVQGSAFSWKGVKLFYGFDKLHYRKHKYINKVTQNDLFRDYC